MCVLRVASVIVLVIALAGCTAEPSGRSDNLRINIIADGHWTIDVPLPADTLSEDGLWPQVRISLGQGNLTWQGGELPLRIQGNGTLIVEALARWDDPCCLFEFNQAQWSHGDMDTPRLPVHVHAGSIDQITIDHTAVACQGVGCRDVHQPATQCSIETKAFAVDLDVGRHVIDTAPPIRTCAP